MTTASWRLSSAARGNPRLPHLPAELLLAVRALGLVSSLLPKEDYFFITIQ